MNKNIFGEPLITCSNDPLTGYFRNGCCDTDNSDVGMHTVCVIATEEFLRFSKSIGNDLSTPIPKWGFMVLILETDGVFVRLDGKKPWKMVLLQK